MALGHSSSPNQTELNYVKIKSHSGGLRPTLKNAVSLRKYFIKHHSGMKTFLAATSITVWSCNDLQRQKGYATQVCSHNVKQ